MQFVAAARADHDYSIAWIRPWGQGRVFYCSLGHRNEVTWDPANAAALLDLLSEYQREGGTVLMVTHEAYAAERAQRTVTMNEGRIQAA